MDKLLFAIVVVAWGLTWYAIHLQVGTPPDVAIFWRFLLSAFVLGGFMGVTGRWKRVPAVAWGWIAGLGLCLFSCNFLAIYGSEAFLPSGTVSVIFSLATVFNIANLWLFFRVFPNLKTLCGGVCGVAGVVFLAVGQGSLGGSGAVPLMGIGLALLGTGLFSLGNMASRKVAACGVDTFNAVVRGMVVGTVVLAGVIVLRGDGFVLPHQGAWIGGLLYLALVGSVIAFMAYLSLVARIGADKAAYSTILSPVIALTVSSFLEHVFWNLTTLLGIGLILCGNLIVFAKLPGRWSVAVR